ncbi:MAG: hypothetical protein ACPGXZ_00220 [Saprospiraceae bacterium]
MKVRCSSIGKLMAASRSKKEQLSKTAKSYIQDVVLEHKYGIKKEFSSRYTDKGNECEEDSITLANEVLNVGFIYKNEEHFENDYITGTPDVNTNEVLLDVKTSFDGTTFPFFEDEIPNKDYYYQLQGYMWLTGKEEALLVYCLTNTPEQIVEDEIRRVHWKEHKLEESDEIRHFVEAKHNFDHIPLEKRVKVFKIQKDEAVIEAIKEKIELAREYYNKIIETI